VPLGVLLVDDQHRIVESNPALYDSLGYHEEQLSDRCLNELCLPQDRKALAVLFDQITQKGELYERAEIRMQREDGTDLWVEVSVGINPPGDALPGQYLVILQDIQQRKEMELEVKEMHRHLNDRVESQRIQLAQELHDGAMQDLHSIHYQLAALQDNLDPECRESIGVVMDTVQGIRQELRTISYDLRPPALSRFGLAKSIRSHAEDFAEKHPEFKIELNLAEDGSRLTEDIRLALFRIYQQALGNILQHSGASEINVKLGFNNRGVELRIQDNGRGFSMPERWISLVRAGHYGLAGSHDRVTSLGGEFQVQSEEDCGTEITVWIPGVVESDE
jgi:PAS domain S-box-containing protein